MTNNYAKAYTEVLEILSHFSKEDYSKIPKEKIEYYQKYMDKNYDFKIDPEIDLSQQHISKEANAIIVNLYRDFYATEGQKEKINEILDLNQRQYEIKKREKYNPDEIFTNKNTDNKEKDKIYNNTNLPIQTKSNNFFVKFINYLKKIFIRDKYFG